MDFMKPLSVKRVVMNTPIGELLAYDKSRS